MLCFYMQNNPDSSGRIPMNMSSHENVIKLNNDDADYVYNNIVSMNSVHENIHHTPLLQFLASRKVFNAKESEVSMTGMGAFKGSWYVSDADYDNFLDLLHDDLFQKNIRHRGFVEQRRSDYICKPLIDLDFKFPPEHTLNHVFGDEHISNFLERMCGLYSKYFDLPKTIRFLVTLRPQAYVETKQQKKDGITTSVKKIKDGIHIVCPDFRIRREHAAFIRHCVLEENIIQESFGNIGYTNNEKDIYDTLNDNKTGWFFYGESKPDVFPYKLSHVFKYNSRTGKFSEESNQSYSPRELLELSSIRILQNSPLINPKDAMLGEINQKMETMKTMHRVQENIQNTPSLQQMDIFPKELSSWNQTLMSMIRPENVSDFEFIEGLVQCLSAERADGYDSWIRVGWCLKNISNGQSSEKMFDLWMDFSKKSPKFSENNVEQLKYNWNRNVLGQMEGVSLLQIGSLVRWAQEDDYAGYLKVRNNDIHNYITKVAKSFSGGTHTHFAKMMYKLYGDRFRCAIDGKNVEWYEFKNHVWKKVPLGLELKICMSNEVSEIIAETKAMVRNEYFKRKAEETSRRSQGDDDENPRGHDSNDYSKKDDMEEKEFKETMQQFLKLEQNLYDERNKEQILKACVQVFKDEEFSKRLNANPYLLGCANGILELRKPVYDSDGKFVKFTTELRPGKPDDYVSFQMGLTEGDLPALEYYPYNPEDPMQTQVQDFFAKIFPNEELRVYMLTLMAGCLEGDDKEQAFYFLIGAGGNGKSKLMELMANVFGQYASTANTTLITRKKADAGAATPELACLRGARFIALQEPDENDVLNTARIKQLCGHDLVESRGLYKEQERFRIMGKWFMCSNRDPKVNSMDWGTWRRFKKIFFESSFVGEDKKNTVDHSKHIYLRDPDMDAALRKWRSAFFSLLVHYYETQYCPDGIKKIPEMVEKYTRAYRDSYDTFGKFVLSRVRTATVNDDRALGKRVDYRPFFASFKKWCDFNGLSRLSENEFKTRLLERFRPINENDNSTKWAFENILLFESDEDAETFDKHEEEETGFVDDA